MARSHDPEATPDPQATQGIGAVPGADEPDPTVLRSRRRFARRQWTRRWLAWRPVLAITAVVLLVVGGIWLVFFSSYFAVQGVDVTGAQQLRAAQVERAASVPVGEPLARVDLDRIRRRVEALAAVKSADVTRQWPDQVRIAIVERQPVAVVEIGGKLHALDEDGVVFRDLARAPAGLPRVATTAATAAEALREGALVVAALPAELAAKVDHVDVATVDEITLELRDGRQVIWGSAELSDQKAAVLADLLVAVKARQYDVSVPGQPTTTKQQGKG